VSLFSLSFIVDPLWSTATGYREEEIEILMDLPLKTEDIPPDLATFLWMLPKRPCAPTKRHIVRAIPSLEYTLFDRCTAEGLP
jgi:hypothetical protein